MARKMPVVLHRLQTIRNAEQVMQQHVDLKFLKPVARLEAERLGAFDELGEIANAIDLAALAVIGMAKRARRGGREPAGELSSGPSRRNTKCQQAASCGPG